MRHLFVSLMLLLAACTPQDPQAAFEDLTRARSFAFEGNAYLAEFNSFAAEKEQTLDDGTVVRAFGIFESIDVSRGNGKQFLNTDGDRLEAQAAAEAYCDKIGLAPPAGATVSATFTETYADQNSEWRFEGICTLPPSDWRVS